MKQPVSHKDHKVPRVPDAPAEEGPGRLVELEGEVRGRGEHGEDKDDVWVRHVDEAARHGVGDGKRGQEVERGVDGVLAPPLVEPRWGYLCGVPTKRGGDNSRAE